MLVLKRPPVPAAAAADPAADDDAASIPELIGSEPAAQVTHLHARLGLFSLKSAQSKERFRNRAAINSWHGIT